MAISFNIPPEVLDYEAEPQSIAIKGQLLTAEWSCSSYIEKDPKYLKGPDDIKKILATELALKMLQHNLVEFTKQYEAHTNMYVFRARCYLTPDKQVRLIRTNEILP
jgi:hypothetical protein